jgi:hypothetical protein
VQVLSNLNEKVDTNPASSSPQVQDQQVVNNHLNQMIKQVQAMFLFSNRLILQEIIHWTL